MRNQQPPKARGLAGLASAGTGAVLLLLATLALGFPTYEGCEECHGEFNGGALYTSLHDGTEWGMNLMDGHLAFTSSQCEACHKVLGPGDVFLNDSMSSRFPKGCVGCHGRDEDVTEQCTGEPGGTKQECGSGAGLRQVHELNVGAGTCTQCHGNDLAPVGEHFQPFNFGGIGMAVEDPCNGDGSESQYGPDGLDNDGDGERDGNDVDCQQGSAFLINAGLNDAWFNTLTVGQGFFIIVFEDLGLVFLSWFTYDTERPGAGVPSTIGEAGHRWLTALGPFEGDTATLAVELTQGGLFNSPQPKPDQSPDGTIVLEFAGCNEGLVTYDITSAGVSGEIPIERVALSNVPACEAAQAVAE